MKIRNFLFTLILSVFFTISCFASTQPEKVEIVFKVGDSTLLINGEEKTVETPYVVDSVSAVAGIDIGDTFIGMHLKNVAVPVRVGISSIGDAHLTLARTRCKFVGGERAIYDPKLN